jgi:Tol biopolymer transport system component
MTDARLGAKAAEAPAEPLVRTELDRILSSEVFARSERLSSFLRFIVERTLSGDGGSLKEQVIAIELYGKDPDFDTATDPIVRVDARRLRDKLREYYASAGDAALVISVPKGGYTPVFLTPVLGSVASATAPPVSSFVRHWQIAAAVLVLLAALLWLTRSRIRPGEEAHQIAVTSLPGSEEDPALSPNGQFVAFSHSGSEDLNHDIWIMPAGGGVPVNVTKTPDANEEWPRWSPDGRWITFSLLDKNGWAVMKVSPLGGVPDPIANHALDASWTNSSRALVMYERTTPAGHTGLVYQELSGARHSLTDTPLGFDDRHPRVSPDGATVAFIRIGQGRSAIFTVPLIGGTLTQIGEWSHGLPIGGIDWMPDGRELLAAKWTGTFRRLLQIPVNPRGPEVTVPGIPSDVAGVSLSRVGENLAPPYRLAVSYGRQETGLRLIDLAPPRSPAFTAADSPFCAATRVDIPGRFSPDGSQVAFVSNRNGGFQVWVANRDGSDSHPVTDLKDAMVSLGSWSPDGQLAFDATIQNRSDIYIVGKHGGRVRQLTTDGRGNASDPEWSGDGKWIYFSSTRSGSAAIWKMPAEGGNPVPLTFEAGFDPRESPDRKMVYFIDRPRGFGVNSATTLKRVPVGGGPIEDVGIRVAYGAWDVTDSGIVSTAEQSEGLPNSRGGKNVLQQFDFADHRIRPIARLGFIIGPFGVPRFLAVSRDGRWALASHIDRWERDVMVLDGVR